MTKADLIRQWWRNRSPPATTSDCTQCAAETGCAAKYVWIIMRHERTADQRAAYYAEQHRRRYAEDPAYRERKREYSRQRYAKLAAAKALSPMATD